MARTDCQHIDLRGSIAPFTFLKICKAFKTLQPGECLKILWNDRDTGEGLLKILPAEGYRVECGHKDGQGTQGVLTLRKVATTRKDDSRCANNPAGKSEACRAAGDNDRRMGRMPPVSRQTIETGGAKR